MIFGYYLSRFCISFIKSKLPIRDLTREGGTDNTSIGNRGSFTDEENAGMDNMVKGIEEGSNKRRISGTERK
jgi:hypothetical protein